MIYKIFKIYNSVFIIFSQFYFTKMDTNISGDDGEVMSSIKKIRITKYSDKNKTV